MASLGGFGAVNGTSTLGGGSTPPGRDFIDTVQTITSDGSLESFDVYMNVALTAGSFKLKVWRVNGTNYDFVGQSQSITSLSAGLNSGVTLTTPISVLAGDLVGVFLSHDSPNSALDCNTPAGGNVDFKTGDDTTSQLVGNYTALADLALSVEVFGTVSGGGGDTIALTEKGVGQVIQRAVATSNASVTLAGTYTGTPTAIEYRILDAADDTTEISTWATLDASPSGGVFSSAVTVPQGGWYHAQVRFSNDTAINDLQANGWGVGVLVGCIGQSNIQNWFTDGTGTAPAEVSVYNGSWAKQGTTGTGAISFGNTVATQSGVPVGLVNYSVGATGLVSGVTSPYWGDFTGSLYTNFRDGVTAVGGALEFVLWVQGEQDAFVGSPTVTEANYTSTLNSLVSQIRTDITNGGDQTNLPVIISQLGRATNGATDANTQAVKDALYSVATTTADCYLGAVTYDLALSDTVHFTTAGYTTHGERMAQAVLDVTGDVTFHRGPAIASATLVDSTTIDVTISHVGGSDFTPTSSITGFEVFDDGSPVAVSTAVRQSATVIRLGLGAAIAGDATVRYAYGVNPTVTGAVKDNSTETLPLEELGTAIAAAAISSTLSISIAGIPDGAKKTYLINPADDSVVYAANVTYSGGAGSATVGVAAGTVLKGLVDDGVSPPTDGAVIYGTTA